MIGVRLRPGVAFILSGIAAQAIVGRRISLREIPAFHELVSAEAQLQTPEQCIDALQGFLLQSLMDAHVQVVVAAAMREIERAQGCVRVAEVAARCGVSPRHLNRLMRMWVGYNPKCLQHRQISGIIETNGPFAESTGRGSGVRDRLFRSVPPVAQSPICGCDTGALGLEVRGRFFQDPLRRPPLDLGGTLARVGRVTLSANV